MKATVKELAAKLDVDYAHAAGLVKIMEKKGLTKVDHVRPNPAGRGKGSNVYELPDKIELNLVAA